jgi:hypothetical protein
MYVDQQLSDVCHEETDYDNDFASARPGTAEAGSL